MVWASSDESSDSNDHDKEIYIMKCPRCGAEMKIKNIKVDTDIYGTPIYHKYAYCFNCKVKRNLGQEKGAAKKPGRLSTRRAARHKRKRHLIMTAVCLLLAALTGTGVYLFLSTHKKPTDQNKQKETVIEDTSKNKIDRKTFSKLETGMTLEETVDLIGTDGNKLMQASSDESSVERYQWKDTSGNGTVLLIFQDGKLVNISQSGMRDTKLASLSTESARNVKFGAAYNELASELGGDGELISETLSDGSLISMYMWKDNDSDIRMTVVFKDDKVQSAN